MPRSEKTKTLSSWQVIIERQKKEQRESITKTPKRITIEEDEEDKTRKISRTPTWQTFIYGPRYGVSKPPGGPANEEEEDDDDDDLETPCAPRELGLQDLLKKAKEITANNKARRENSEVARRAEAARVEIRLQLEEEQKAYLASEAHKETVAQLKDELRAQTTEDLKAEIFEQGVKDFRAENEEMMKQQLEEHLLAHLNEHLPAQLAAELKPEVEQMLRQELESEVRAQLMRELPAKLAPKIEAELRPKIEERLRKELGAKLEREQLAKADPVSPLVQPEIDGISYPDLKRASPDDDFSRNGKRRRPSYDYDGEHTGDHEERVTNILDQALQEDIHRTTQSSTIQPNPLRTYIIDDVPPLSSDDELPRPYVSTTPPPQYAPGTSLFLSPFPSPHADETDDDDGAAEEEEEEVEEGEEQAAPDEDEIFDIRAYHRQQALKRGRPVEYDEADDDDDFEIRKKLIDDYWASASSRSHSASPPRHQVADEGEEGEEDDGFWEGAVAAYGAYEAGEDGEETVDEEDEEEDEGEGEGVEMRGSSKEDAILLDSDPDEA